MNRTLYHRLIELLLMTSGQMLNAYIETAQKAEQGERTDIYKYQDAMLEIRMLMEKLRRNEDFQQQLQRLPLPYVRDFHKTLEVLSNLYNYLEEVKDYDNPQEAEKQFKRRFDLIPWRDPKATA